MTSTSAVSQRDDEIRRTVAGLINEIFHEFKTRLRNWRQYMPDQESVNAAKKSYVRLLLKYHIGNEGVIREACERVCTDMRWYQTPDDFISVCLDIMGERLNLPSTEESLQQALRNSASTHIERHESVRYTLKHMGSDQVSRLKSDKSEDALKRWRKYWRQTIHHLACGGNIHLLEKPEEVEKPPCSRERSAEHLQNLKSVLGF